MLTQAMPYRTFDQNCSIARTLEVVGERWTILVLREISLGFHRFEEIQRHLGIATNVLADRLTTLVDRGVVKRVPTERPDRFEYRFTRKGASLSPVITAMMHWGDTWEAPDGPPRLLIHTACGHATHAVATCAHCGEPLEPNEIHTSPGPGATEEQIALGARP
jgi:DNA-binding HxlR family transcriptional regulator